MRYNAILTIYLLLSFLATQRMVLAQTNRAVLAPVNQPDPDKSLQFIQNKNQWDKSVQYMAAIPGGKLFLQNQALLYAFSDNSYLSQHGTPGNYTNNKAPGKVKAHAYSVSFLGASAKPILSGKKATKMLRNYFTGNDPARWAAGVRAYEEVSYEELYPGIAMHLYELKQHLKYEFLIQPRINPVAIRMQYKGADKISLVNGELHIKTSVNEVIEQKPYAYQVVNNQEIEVPCSFKLEQNVVSFVFPEGYNTALPLVIDPTLVFSTFSGSRADNWGFTATYDQDGNMYSGGIVDGIGFPATVGATDASWNGDWDISILKYKTDAAGAASLLYATYLGGSLAEIPSSLIVNSKNELLILGSTGSPDFPATAGSYDESFNRGTETVPLGGIYFAQGSDLFISRLSSDGSKLLASTFLGGSGNEGVLSNEPSRDAGGRIISAHPLDKNYGDQFRGDIFTDSTDNVYIVSSTQSINFPVRGGFQTRNRGANDAVVAKFTAALSLTWSSYLGGSGADAAYSVQMDTNGNIFVAGGTTSPDLAKTTGTFKAAYQGGRADGFIARINSSGTNLEQLSYIGTSDYDQVFFVQLDINNDVYLLGQSLGSYPVLGNVHSTSNGKQFIQKLNNTLTTSIFSTVFGATNASPNSLLNISPTAFLVDNCSRIYVSGWGGDTGEYGNGTTLNMPVTNDAYQKTTDGRDFYLMLLSQDATKLEYATFIGGTSVHGEHVDGGTSRFDKRGFVYQAVCGGCRGTSAFPTTPNAWSRVNGTIGLPNPNCNNAAFKFEVNVAVALAGPDQNICANAAPFQLSGFSPATGGTWSGPGVSSTGTFTPSINLIGTVTLTYTFTNGTCLSTSTKTITVDPLPVVSFTGLPAYICTPATSVTLVGTPVGGTFTGPGMSGNIFDPAAAGTGRHTISYSFTSEAGCTVDSSQTVEVNETPVVEAGPNEQICSGSFPVMLTGFSPAGGTWTGTGVAPNGLFTPSEALVGTHTLTYTFANGSCSIAKTKIVRVDATIKFTQEPPIAVCPDAPAFKLPEITPLGGTWSGAGVTSGGIYTPTPGAAGTNILTYFVSVGACSGISTQQVIVAAPPVVRAGAVPTECGDETNIQGFAPFTASFTNNTTGATSYLWDFGDGTTSTEVTPAHLYANPGQYEVNLNIFYGNGCTLNQKIAAVLVDESRLVPNIFTPNNDGLNDTFRPRITCLPTDLKIFNRWGQMVYEKQNYQNTWRGENLADGIYYYQLTSTKGQIWKGWVEIVR